MAEARVTLAERAALGHLNLRGDPADARFTVAVAQVFGTSLPTAPNTVAAGPRGIAYWLGPDEWLLVTAASDEATLGAALRTALAGVHSAVTEVSGGQVVIELRGAKVLELLAKECPLDLEAPEFAPGRCAQTRLAKAAVLLRPLEGGAVELIVRRSFCDYLWTWLADAGAEYGYVRRGGAAA
jgi:sarcosine oxidase subunit gamma